MIDLVTILVIHLLTMIYLVTVLVSKADVVQISIAFSILQQTHIRNYYNQTHLDQALLCVRCGSASQMQL